jgi:hypothetical protein
MRPLIAAGLLLLAIPSELHAEFGLETRADPKDDTGVFVHVAASEVRRWTVGFVCRKSIEEQALISNRAAWMG